MVIAARLVGTDQFRRAGRFDTSDTSTRKRPRRQRCSDDGKAFSGFSVDDTATAREFYEGVLGLEVSDEGMGG